MPRLKSAPVALGTSVLGLFALGAVTQAAGQSPPFSAAWQALQAARTMPPAMVAARVPARRSPTAVVADVAGWASDRLRPTNRSTSLAVSADGRRLALVWLHNQGRRDPAGEPAVYATTAMLSDLGRFAAPMAIAVRPFDYVGGHPTGDARYNSAHNAPIVLPDRRGGFVALTVPMNANGYAQGLPATGYAYAMASVGASGTRWSRPVLGRLRSVPLGSSLSEMTGGVSPDGTVHVVGQGHLGEFQGGMGYQRWRPWRDAWDSAVLAAPFRTRGGLAYFVEGAGVVGDGLAGKGAIHVAFAWNERGATPTFGLYYLMSPDGGVTWQNVRHERVATPVRYGKNDAGCAVVGAGLGTSGYAGAIPGVHGISMALAPDGAPVIVRPETLPGDPNRAQLRLYTYAGGRWLSVPVGGPVFWNFGATAVTVNATTGNINVVVLDPGGLRRGGQVLLMTEALASVRRGQAMWGRRVVGETANTTNYASSLQVAFVPNREALFVFEPNYQNPGQVAPVLGRARLR